MPCIRCGKITVKLCTCSIEEAKEAFSAWSEVELEQVISTLRMVLDSKQSAHRPLTLSLRCVTLPVSALLRVQDHPQRADYLL